MKKNLLPPLLFVCIILLAGFLRFYKISEDPPGLYIDEASNAYNAYSILTTGKDEYGKAYPLWFRSFGEYKTPVLIYTTAATMAVFGKNEFAVRFPSATAGVMSILLLFLLVKECLSYDRKFFSDEQKNALPLLSAFFLAITPWHIHFSRGGFEANFALALFLLGSYLAFMYYKKQHFWLILISFLCFSLTMYTYHSYRILGGLALLILTIFFFWHFTKKRLSIFLVALIVGVFCLPIVLFSLQPEGMARFGETSAFAEVSAHTLAQKTFTYPMLLVKNYVSFFSFTFLFSQGDGNGRHQVPYMGLLYRFEFIFLLIGVMFLVRQRKTVLARVVFTFLLLSPLGAIIARPSPHTIRSLQMVIPLTILVAYGMIELYRRAGKFRLPLIGVVCLVGIYEMFLYLHAYYVHYPKVNINDWGSGYKEIVLKTEELRPSYQHVVVDKNLSLIYIYYLLYDNKRPQLVDVSWKKPSSWRDEKVLYVKKYYGPTRAKNIVGEVKLPNLNHDTVAQFWKL